MKLLLLGMPAFLYSKGWSTGRRPDGPWVGFGFLGKGQRPPLHQPWVWERSIPGGSRAKPSRQTDVLRASSWKLFHSFRVHMWFCQIWGSQTFSLGYCPKCFSLATGLKNTAWYHLESLYRYAISHYYNRKQTALVDIKCTVSNYHYSSFNFWKSQTSSDPQSALTPPY